MNQRFSIVPIFYLAFLLIPLYWLLTMSFKPMKELAGQLTLYPKSPTLDHYQVIFSDSSWYLGYLNATVYVLMNVAICLVAAIPAAYAFSRYRFFGSRPLFFGLLAFRMMSPAILLIPIVQIFSDLNLIDTYIAVALAHCFFNLPIAIWILEGFISSVPAELDELARIDGYNRGNHVESVQCFYCQRADSLSSWGLDADSRNSNCDLGTSSSHSRIFNGAGRLAVLLFRQA